METLNKILCWAGLHAWYEYDVDFFNPMRVLEECAACGIQRNRLDTGEKC